MAERLGEATGSVSWPRGRRQPARCTSEEFPAANGQTHVNDREGNPFNWLTAWFTASHSTRRRSRSTLDQFRCDLRGEHVVTRARRLVCAATSGRSAGAAPLTIGSLCRSVGFDE